MNTDPTRTDGGDPVPELPRDELDALLRRWHQVNAHSAAQGRDALLQRLGSAAVAGRIDPLRAAPGVRAVPEQPDGARPGPLAWLRSPAISLAACLAILAAIMVTLASMNPSRHSLAWRSGGTQDELDVPAVLVRGLGSGVNAVSIIPAAFCPPAPALEARDQTGNVLGECALQRTDYSAQVTGIFARVTLVQRYHNPFNTKIEAVYTFPLSHRGAVDAMRFTIGDRVVVGEVKERSVARQMYESARDSNQVAALLEQERPNIFTQSVANIEPGATIDVEISYIETIDKREGVCSLVLPMVVAPRYIPGNAASLGAPISHAPADAPAQDLAPAQPPASPAVIPVALTPRNGPVVLGAGVFRPADDVQDAASRIPALELHTIEALLTQATPVVIVPAATPEVPTVPFVADYGDGFIENGVIRADGMGELGGRCFVVPFMVAPGAPFALPTDQVPDAHRITPMPALPGTPGTRTGHDITVNVEIDTGGPAITGMLSGVHDVTRRDTAVRADGLPSRASVSLRNATDIPNRDFVLTWRETADAIRNALFTHADGRGGFFTAMIEPPARVTDAQAVPRELIFVLDTSGSMGGFPIEKAKQVMTRAIDAMRPGDTFNVITFAGSTQVLWDRPRPNTDVNRAEARALVEQQQGSGGTEMMTAIEAALAPTPARDDGAITLESLANLPADGRTVLVRVPMLGERYLKLEGLPAFDLPLQSGQTIPVEASGWSIKLGIVDPAAPCSLELRGKWITREQRRIFVADHLTIAPPACITFRDVMNLPADGRELHVLLNSFDPAHDPLFEGDSHPRTTVSQWVDHLRKTARLSEAQFREAVVTGRWETRDGQRVFVMDRWGGDEVPPVRIVMFLTDGQVGNDMAIIDAVRRNSGHARVFSFGIGNSVNRYLLDSIAQAGRGAADYVLLAEQGDAAVARFTQRMRTPVLSNVSIEIAGAQVTGVVCPALLAPPEGDPSHPGRFMLPDMYEHRPIVVHGRFATSLVDDAGLAVTVRGTSAAGAFEQRVAAPAAEIVPAAARADSPLPALWARAAVGHLMNSMLVEAQQGAVNPAARAGVVALGEQFGIVTQFTSFVAVERASVTVAGKPMLVYVPVEIPDGQNFHGIFGGGVPAPPSEFRRRYLESAADRGEARADELAEGSTLYFGVTTPPGNAAPIAAGSTAPPSAVPASRGGARGAAGAAPAPTSAGRHAAPAAEPMGGGGGDANGPVPNTGDPSRVPHRFFADSDGPVDLRTQMELLDFSEMSPGAPPVDGYEVYSLDAAADFDQLSATSGFVYQESLQRGTQLWSSGQAVDVLSITLGESLAQDAHLGLLVSGQTQPVDHAGVPALELSAALADIPDRAVREEARAGQPGPIGSPAESRTAGTGGAEQPPAPQPAPAPASSMHDPAGTGQAAQGGDVDRQQRDNTESEAREAELLWRRLHPVLIERLWTLAAPRSQPGEAKDRDATGAIGPATMQRITLLVEKVDRDTLAALAKAGLKVQASNTRLCVVVGEVRLDRLREVALADGVKRIEPTREQQR